MGALEIGELLGVSRQRVDQLTRRPDFPHPAIETAAGRLWVRREVERWAVADGRIERTEPMSTLEYRILPWKALVTTGGSSPYDSLEIHLNEQGADGWRFDQRIMLDYGTQQIEYGVFVKETDSESVFSDWRHLVRSSYGVPEIVSDSGAQKLIEIELARAVVGDGGNPENTGPFPQQFLKAFIDAGKKGKLDGCFASIPGFNPDVAMYEMADGIRDLREPELRAMFNDLVDRVNAYVNDK